MNITLLGLLVVEVHLSKIVSLVDGDGFYFRVEFVDIDSLLLGVCGEVDGVLVIVVLAWLNQDDLSGEIVFNAVLVCKNCNNDCQQNEYKSSLHFLCVVLV